MYDFKFADIGEGIHEGRILKWNYAVGDAVKEGETLVIIETDKVNAEIPSPVSGTVVSLGAKLGETIHVGETLVVINEENKNDFFGPAKTEAVSEDQDAGVVGQLVVSEEIIASSIEQVKTDSAEQKKVLASPVARKLASELGLDIRKIKGTGEQGRVMKEDVYKAFEASKAPKTGEVTPEIPLPKIREEVVTPAAAPIKRVDLSNEPGRRVKVSTLRKTIVKAMTISKQVIPHTTLMDELDVTELVNFRQSQKAFAADKGIKLTYMPFVIKAAVLALKDFPLFNASFDDASEEIIYKDDLNIGIAVDTPDGLIVPNIKNADRLGLFQLAKKVEDLQTRGQNRTLVLEDLVRGTFTITNFGAFDALFGAPIIKHPEVAILGIGKITKKPIVKNNEIVIADILPITVTVDHRIIDGADAGRFAMRFKEYLKNPLLLLMN